MVVSPPLENGEEEEVVTEDGTEDLEEGGEHEGWF